MRRLVENRRDFATAKKLRETFTDRPMQRVVDLNWSWPRSMDEIGVCTAVMYTSDKWKKIGDFEDYKHIDESGEERHKLLITKGFNPGIETHCESYTLERMPDAVAELANILGLQFRLFGEDGELGEDYFQMNIKSAKLGAAIHPNGETLLLVYTTKALCCVITGFEVEKDGIVK